MPSASSLLTVAAAVSSTSAAFQGFNYGSTFSNGAVKVQSDFENEFKTAASLDGTKGAFTSARLYTMIQGGTTNTVISAIPAAINTKTSLLLGLWASAGGETFNNEIVALQNTIDQFCGKIDNLVAGISVGSEDLYRISETGVAAGSDPGCSPDVLVGYIESVRKTVKGTCLEKVPIGHVDTWNAYSNSSNTAVIKACDWLGMDTYPYYEDTKNNPVSESLNLFQAAYEKISAVAEGKEIWVTETGWPVSGKTSNKAIPSVKNARTYWTDIGCPLFGNTNVWWYTLQDSAPVTPNPSFGVIGSTLTKTPLYDLSCDGVDKSNIKVGSSNKGSGSSDARDLTSSSVTSETSETSETSKTSKASATSAAPTSSSISTSTSTSAQQGGHGSHSQGNSTGSSSPASGSATMTPSSTPTSGSGSGSGSGTQPSSTTATGNGAKVNSFGAAAVALIIAAFAL
ncbi:glycoside hydrolase superfamily [Mariannaea sp. PMI_226]|nr:glycoside hydrolase superfamily [Mariannaea sp. PMI_226]